MGKFSINWAVEIRHCDALLQPSIARRFCERAFLGEKKRGMADQSQLAPLAASAELSIFGPSGDMTRWP